MRRATAACTFSTAQFTKIVRKWCVFNMLTLKCASRHSGVHFLTSQLPKVIRTCCVFTILTWTCTSHHNDVRIFNDVFGILTSKCASHHSGLRLISHPARCFRTRRFSEPTFRPSGASKHWKKNSVSQLFYPFARFDLLSSCSLSSLTLPTTFAASVHMLEVWLLNSLLLFRTIFGWVIHSKPLSSPLI